MPRRIRFSLFRPHALTPTWTFGPESPQLATNNGLLGLLDRDSRMPHSFGRLVYAWHFLVGIIFTMSLTPIIGTALKVPLFHGLEPDQMSELVRRAERVVYETGDALIDNGEHGDCAIMVITGNATQFNPFSTMHPYDSIKPGSLVSEMAMLVETTHHLTVVADTPIKALKFHRSMIEAFMAEDPRLADHFVARIASRLTDLAAEMRATMAAPSAVGAAPHIDDIPARSKQPSPVTGASVDPSTTAFPLN